MAGVVIPRRADPSWSSGFARSNADALRPSLRNGLVLLSSPVLGPTGKQLHDVSLYSNLGTFTDGLGPQDWEMTEKGWALRYDGSDAGKVDFGDAPPLNFTEPMTATAWIHPITTTSFRTIIAKRSVTYAFHFRLSSGALSMLATSGSTTSSLVPPANEWSFVAVTMSVDGSMTFYLNSQSEAGAAQNITPQSGVNVTIGSTFNDALNFDGLISTTSLHNRALTPNEIAQAGTSPASFFERSGKVLPTPDAAVTGTLTPLQYGTTNLLQGKVA